MRFRERKIVEMILTKEDLYLDDFQIKKETGNFFKANNRPVIIRPAKFSISEPEVDELNNRPGKARFKITLSFELLKGSYATIVTKRLFGQ
ncbi:MAG: tRNA pseudouridine(13) synthase TruD [Candidatus Woesearchaeota archaeon]|nr:tRNA pseudouridine(13) synthase TruD [Candidatus Woesearchaeota archaeon]